ncbi:hypothetical protein BD560DRAFT_218667 [Blakeslea trispora]|nr:hypothetical protein BD560DRAFT_218667 [Blakeslea trispora]
MYVQRKAADVFFAIHIYLPDKIFKNTRFLNTTSPKSKPMQLFWKDASRVQSTTADEIEEESSDDEVDLVSDDEEIQQQERADELLFHLEAERLGEAVLPEEPRWNQFTDPFMPFNTVESMILHVLMNGDNDMISERMMKKILYAFKLVLIVAEKAFKDRRRVRLPTLNKLMRYQNNIRNEIPVFPSKSVVVDLGNNETANATINMPSDHLQLLAANPKKAPLIFSVPDQSTCLQQAGKMANSSFVSATNVELRGRRCLVWRCCFEFNRWLYLQCSGGVIPQSSF